MNFSYGQIFGSTILKQIIKVKIIAEYPTDFQKIWSYNGQICENFKDFQLEIWNYNYFLLKPW